MLIKLANKHFASIFLPDLRALTGKKVPQQDKADIDDHVYVNSSGDKNADCEKILSLNTDIEPITSLIKVRCWNNRAITPTGPNWMLVKLSVCDIP